MNPTFTKGYEVSAAVEGLRLVKFAAPGTDSTVNTAAAATDPIIGVSDVLGAATAGDMLDVHSGGLVSVQLGGAVSAGDPLTADANGKAIAAVAAASTTVRVLGYATAPGVADDIIDAMWAPALLHEA